MAASIPSSLLKKWIHDLSMPKANSEANTDTDFFINKGVQHGLDLIQHRITTWLAHKKNTKILSRSGEKFLITKDIDISHGRYRKLELYQGNQFITLAWRHAKDAERGRSQKLTLSCSEKLTQRMRICM